MATILQFAEELSVGQGWSPGERAQLREIGVQLSDVLDDVELVFGKTERGDPWCAVTDSSGEVLLHIARIDGTFVVHSPSDDRIVEGPDLWGTAARLLGDALRERRGVILAFPPDTWAPPAALAVIMAIALRDEFGDFGPHDHPLPGSASDGTAQSAWNDDADDGGGGLAPLAANDSHRDEPDQESGSAAPAAIAAAKIEASPAQAAAGGLPDRGDAPAGQPATGGAPVRLAHVPQDGGRGDPPPEDHSRAAPASTEAAIGEFTAGRAPAGPHVIEGGSGSDRLMLGPGVVAEGKGGADLFIAPSPGAAAANAGPVLVGVIADMHKGEGDRFEIAGARFALVTGQSQVADILSTFRGRPGMDDLPAVSGRKVVYDVDGDGRPDAYVLIADHGGTWLDALRKLDARPGPGAGEAGLSGVVDTSPAATPPTTSLSPWSPSLEGPPPPPLAQVEVEHPPQMAAAPHAPPELDLLFA